MNYWRISIFHRFDIRGPGIHLFTVSLYVISRQARYIERPAGSDCCTEEGRIRRSDAHEAKGPMSGVLQNSIPLCHLSDVDGLL